MVHSNNEHNPVIIASSSELCSVEPCGPCPQAPVVELCKQSRLSDPTKTYTNGVIRHRFSHKSLKNHFVGEIDLPEGALVFSYANSMCSSEPSEQEPLLTESKRRFVLFPIQHDDVRSKLVLIFHPLMIT